MTAPKWCAHYHVEVSLTTLCYFSTPSCLSALLDLSCFSFLIYNQSSDIAAHGIAKSKKRMHFHPLITLPQNPRGIRESCEAKGKMSSQLLSQRAQ